MGSPAGRNRGQSRSGDPGPAGHQVQQPGPYLPVLVTGQIDHAGQLLRAPLGDRHVVPDVLTHTESLDTVEAGLIGVHRLQQRGDAAPHRPPARAQLPGDPGDRGMLTTHLPDRPPARPPGQQRPRRGELLVLFGEGTDRAGRLWTPPGPLPPQQPHRSPECRSIDQAMHPAAVTMCDHPTPGAAGRCRRGLHRYRQPALTGVHVNDVESLQANEQVTVAAVRHWCANHLGTATPRRLRHRRGPRRNRKLGRS